MSKHAETNGAVSEITAAVQHHHIDQAAAEEYGVTTEEMHSPSRRQPVCMARCAAWLWLQKTLGWTTTRIGMSYGRTHGSVVHGIQRYRWLASHEWDTSHRYQRILKAINEGGSHEAGTE